MNTCTTARAGRLAVLTAVLGACALWLAPVPAAQEGPCGGAGARGSQDGPHGYFASLAARPECFRAFSLRDAAQVRQFTHSKRRPEFVSYNPAEDKDPRRQDAARIAIPAGKVSLPNQVRLPIGTADGTTTLVTWDAWFGAEFHIDRSGVANYKTFQFASPADRIWFEVRTRFKQDEARNARQAGAAKQSGRRPNASGRENRRERRPARNRDAEPTDAAAAAPPPETRTAPRAAEAAKSGPASPADAGGRLELGVVDARAYGGGGQAPFGPNVQRNAPLAPQAGSFTIRAETWTRYWVLIEQRANDWDLVSLWVADETRDPVQLLDRIQLTVKRSVESFWLEYNTSSRPRQGLGERIAYVRNVVMLRGVNDVAGLLRRPGR